MNFFKILFTVLIITIVVGCSSGVDKKAIIAQGPFIQPYEKVWVNPQIIYSDTLFTIMKAERLDSIEVLDAPPATSNNIVTISFNVSLGSCRTIVELKNNSGEVQSHIFDDYLDFGFYKLTLDSRRIDLEGADLSSLYLETRYCGNTLIQQILE